VAYTRRGDNRRLISAWQVGPDGRKRYQGRYPADEIERMAAAPRALARLPGLEVRMPGVLCWLGELGPAEQHYEQGIALSDVRQHRCSTTLFGADLGVLCRTGGCHTLWLLGYPDQALGRGREGLARARSRAYPFILAPPISSTPRPCWTNSADPASRRCRRRLNCRRPRWTSIIRRQASAYGPSPRRSSASRPTGRARMGPGRRTSDHPARPARPP